MGKRRNSDVSDDESEQEEVKYYGEPKAYDPNFNGPISNRSCTDIICCLVFTLFIIGLAAIGTIGFKRGDVETLIYPTDYLGQVCGVSENVISKQNLFFFDYIECLNEAKAPRFECTESVTVCVETCPNKSYSIDVKYNGKLNTGSTTNVDWDDFICVYEFDPEKEVNHGSYTIQDILDSKKCANYYTKSDIFAGRCFPDYLTEWQKGDPTPNNRSITDNETSNAYDILNYFQKYERFNSTVEDFKQTWPYMVLGITISMFASLLYIILMRWIAAIMVWSSIFLVYALLICGTYFCWKERNCIKTGNPNCISNSFEFGDYEEISSYAKMEKTWYITAIILSTILAILTLVMLFLFKRIRIAIALIKEASRAVSSMLCSLLWPVIPFIMQLSFLTYWCFSVIFIISIVEPPYQIFNATNNENYTNGMACEPTEYYGEAECILVGYNIVPNYVYWFLAYNLVALFWILNFISALGETTLAGGFASYYWAFTKPDDIKSFPLIRSFWRCIRYHIGSIAFGSLIITLIQLIRVGIEFVERNVSNAENVVTKFLFKCCKCCLWCLEKFMRFINRNAYIEIAVYGESFCTSAKNAFFLLMRNVARVAVLNGISSFMLFLGKMVITLATAFGASVFFSNYWSKSPNDGEFVVPDLNYFWMPILLMSLAAYIVADIFFGVYDMAIDTLFLCFLEDLERNDGTPMKPYYMSKKLMDILGVKNEKIKKKKKGCCH